MTSFWSSSRQEGGTSRLKPVKRRQAQYDPATARDYSAGCMIENTERCVSFVTEESGLVAARTYAR